MMNILSDEIQGVYIDVSSSPYRTSCFFQLLSVMKNAGSRYLFIDFGEYFPWSEDFHFGSEKEYPETMVQKLNEKAHQFGIEIIPVLSVFDNNDFIIKEKHYRHFAPGFPDNPQIVHDAVGLTALYGEMIDDLFSLLTHSLTVCLKVPPAMFNTDSKRTAELSRLVSEKNKKLIVQNLSLSDKDPFRLPVLSLYRSYQHDRQCSIENMYYLQHAYDSRIVITEITSAQGFLPFDCLKEKLAQVLSTGRNSSPRRCADSCTLLEDFRILLHRCWDAYKSVSEHLSLFFMRENPSVVVALFEEMAHFENFYRLLMEKAQECSVYFKSNFNDTFIDTFFCSKTEPLEEALQCTALKLKRIKRRVE